MKEASFPVWYEMFNIQAEQGGPQGGLSISMHKWPPKDALWDFGCWELLDLIISLLTMLLSPKR